MFHDKVREMRLHRNLTQKQLADAAEIAVGSMSAYEKGQKMPPVDVAGRLAAALGVSLDWLLNDAPMAEAMMPEAGCMGDAARAFLTMVDAGMLDHAAHMHVDFMTSMLTDQAETVGDMVKGAFRLTIDLAMDNPMVKFIEGVYKLGKMVADDTLDVDIYHTWLERELEKLDRIPLQKD